MSGPFNNHLAFTPASVAALVAGVGLVLYVLGFITGVSI